MERKVRVRFAPSPTGPLHMGGVRTALFNYLFAKKNGGDFLLRIEDTDQTRYVPGAEAYIIESLKWCGINPDEGVEQGGEYGPYRQSERKDIYKEYAKKLLDENKAYYAFDTPEDLENMRKELKEKGVVVPQYDAKTRITMRNSLTLSESEVQSLIDSGIPYVVRFKMPDNHEVVMQDIIRGEIKVNTARLDDKVLFKSDGMPTYHLANVVDDYSMKISHVIRGEEWLPSMPLHVMMYKAFGWEAEMPQFAHLPLLLKPSGQGKLSKRDGDKLGFPVFPLQWKDPSGEISAGYREAGYFSEAFVNLLALLGWNPGTEQEIFTLDELIEVFSLERVSKSGARFDPEKAKWFNHKYLQSKSNAELAHLFKIILNEKEIATDNEVLERIIGMVKERADFVHDLWPQTCYFFEAPDSYDKKVVKKRWKADTPEQMHAIIEVLKGIEPFESTVIEEKVKAWIETKQLGLGKIMNAFRLCVVGAGMGPHLFDIVEIIGKEETLARIQMAIEKLKC